MSESIDTHTVSKREFLRYCMLGLGGWVCGLHRWEALGGVVDVGQSSAPPMDELWKWSKEAMFYTSTPSGVRCLKCPRGCVLSGEEAGWCRNRVHHNGKLYTIAYGNPCAVHIDPIEKKPFFHFLPTTRAFSIAVAGCNFRCLNCQNWQISQVSPKETENTDMMPAKVVEECLASRCESIAYTYSEPLTFYEYAYDTAVIARGKKVRSVLKSNGYIHETPLRTLCTVLDAANIDLKCYDDDIYRRLSSGTLAPVLRTLKVLKEEGVWLEITNLVVPDWTDNLEMIRRMCDWLVVNKLHDSPLHFSRFVPLYKLTQLPTTPVSTLENARAIAMKAGMQYVYIGNVPGHSAENTYCHKCGKMIIERKGYTIVRNDVVRSTCRFCGARIPGVWA